MIPPEKLKAEHSRLLHSIAETQMYIGDPTVERHSEEWRDLVYQGDAMANYRYRLERRMKRLGISL